MGTRNGLSPNIAFLLIGLLLLAASGFLAMAQAKTLTEVYVKPLVYETELVSVDFEIPQVALADHPDLEARLNEGWLADVKALADHVTASAEDFFDEFGDEVSHWFPFILSGEFQVGYVGEEFLSIPIRYYCFTGGAHGMSYQVATNISIETGRELALADLFVPDYDYRGVIRAEVLRQMDAEPDIYFQESFQDIDITPEQPFYFTDAGLVVYFGLYEIAPYSSGIREFTITFTKLWEGLRPKIKGVAN